MVNRERAACWRPDMVPTVVIEDMATRRALDGAWRWGERVLWSDHATRTDAPSGTWVPADDPRVLAIAGEAVTRAHAGLARLADGTLVVVRRRIDGVRVVVGVLSGWDGRTEPLVAWREALRLAWEAPNFDTLGVALSQEKAGALDLAARNFAAVRALDPENPWPRYYLGRVEAARGAADLALEHLTAVAREAAPAAIVARLRAERDDEWTPLRSMPEYQALMAELRAAVPVEPADFAAYLVRFRRSLFRIDDVLVPGGPAREPLYRFLEARTLDAPSVSGLVARWETPRGDALLELRETPEGLRVAAIREPDDVAPRSR